MALVVIKFSLKIRLILKSNFVLKSYHSYCFVASVTFCIWGQMILPVLKEFTTPFTLILLDLNLKTRKLVSYFYVI